MILDDAAADRYSRHVLLQEIGPAGQRRLLDARVRVAGDHPARAFTAELLSRSGLGLAAAGADVTVHVGAGLDPDTPMPCVAGWTRGQRVVVLALIGRPCPACVATTSAESTAAPLAAQALAAAVASTVVRHVVTPPATSTRVTLDLGTGHLEDRPLLAPPCPRCARSRAELQWTRSS